MFLWKYLFHRAILLLEVAENEGRIIAPNKLRIEVLRMTELVLNTNTLPEPLFRLINTTKVMVNQDNGIICLIPIQDNESDCPLFGIATDCGFTVDEFLARKREEKVLEGE